MVTAFKPTQRPRRFYKLRRTPYVYDVPELPSGIGRPEALRDEFGLAFETFQQYPTEARRLIAKAMRELGLPLNAHPRPFGTITEMVMFGLLLEHGFRWYVGQDPTNGTFVFQSYELGGRQPGGAVVDFVLFYGNTEIGIRVQSIFHSALSPFGRGAGDMRERDQEIRLLEQGFEKIVDVNRPLDGFPLENGTPEMIHREMDRVLGRVAA